jgi:hypothetical protein
MAAAVKRPKEVLNRIVMQCKGCWGKLNRQDQIGGIVARFYFIRTGIQEYVPHVEIINEKSFR